MLALNYGLLCLITLICVCSRIAYAQQYYRTEDVFVPDQCESVVGPGDHLLLEYVVRFKNGTRGSFLKRPSQLFHIIVNFADESPVLSSVKGMCANATRRIIWDDPNKIDMYPLFVKGTKVDAALDGLTIDITTAHVTTSDEYQIFSSLRESNFTNVAEMIDNHVGVNAVDEWGQTPLMIAVQMKHLPIIAALLNTRLPKVNVNAAKPSGYTAIFYAVEHSSPSILTALLRRGANPNVGNLQEGNTPLHYACLMEKTKHAELLLEFGADAFAKNQYGQTPHQLIPGDAVRSTKLFFKKMFEDAAKKIKDAEAATLETSHSRMMNQRTDL